MRPLIRLGDLGPSRAEANIPAKHAPGEIGYVDERRRKIEDGEKKDEMTSRSAL